MIMMILLLNSSEVSLMPMEPCVGPFTGPPFEGSICTIKYKLVGGLKPLPTLACKPITRLIGDQAYSFDWPWKGEHIASTL
jgi:hypothetical protein